MIKKIIYPTLIFVIIFILAWLYVSRDDGAFPQRVKISLRNVGHQLLLANKDSTSLVLPIIELEQLKYKLSFQNNLVIEPENLVKIIENNFVDTNFPKEYIIEVKKCGTQDVAYSFEITNKKETAVACLGRMLPKDCYEIEVSFLRKTHLLSKKNIFTFIYIVGGFIILFFLNKAKKRKIPTQKVHPNQILGEFKFYQEQNKLVKGSVEISLSKKECELLSIFISKPNQVVKRAFLTKKVWEDKGVIVGRSLDTYISKLRKKLSIDNSVKLCANLS